MFTIPMKRHTIVPLSQPKIAGYDARICRGRDFSRLNPTIQQTPLRGAGIPGLTQLKRLASEAISGRIPTAIKTKLNRRHGFHRAYKGEKHPISITRSRRTGKKTIAFNSYLGPSTNVSTRLRAGVKPLPGPQGQYDSADRCGMAHDIRFAVAKTPADLRRADRIFINKLKQLERRGHPRLNTQIGIKGIQLKNKLEDKKIWSNKKFLNPMSESDPAKAIARRELANLEQHGYGSLGLPGGSVPGKRLRKKILRGLMKTKPYMRDRYGMPRVPMKRRGKGITFSQGRVRPAMGMMIRPSDLAKLMMKRVVPTLIQKIAKRVGFRPKMFGKGIKNQLMLDMTRSFKSQFGGAIGLATLAALAPLGITAATTLTPLAIKLGKFIVPKILKLFRRGRGYKDQFEAQQPSKWDPRMIFGKALFKIIGPIAKKMMKGSFPAIAKLLGMGGGAFLGKIKALVGKAGKKFVDVMGKMITGTRKAIPYAQKGIKGISKGLNFVQKNIRSPRDVAKVLLNQALPALVGMIRQKTGIKPRKMGKGIKRKMENQLIRMFKIKKQYGGAIGIATLLGLAGTAAPIVIPLVAKAAKFLLPKIIGLFKRIGKRGRGKCGGSFLNTIGKIGKAAKPLIGLLKPIIMKLLMKMGKNLKIGKMMGFGIRDFIKNIGKKFTSAVKMILSPEFRTGFSKGFMGVMKPAYDIGKVAAPILVKQGLPLLLKMLAKSG